MRTASEIGVTPERATRERAIWDLVFMFSVVSGVFIVVFRDYLLPRRFFYDGEHIQDIAKGINSGFGDQSYVRVALVYRALGLADHPLLAGLFGFGLGVLAILLVRLTTRRSPSGWALILTPIAVVLMAVYLGFYSKDVFLIPIAALSLSQAKSKRVEIFLIIAMLSYAALFRSYWLLIAISYITIRFALRRRKKWRSLIVVTGVLLIVFCLGLFFAIGVNPDHYRTMVNDARATSEDAASAIRSILPGDSLAVGILNVIITLILLVVPLPLLLIGGAYHATLFVGIFALWLIFFIGIRGDGRNIFRESVSPVVVQGEGNRYRAASVVMGLLVVQAIFEPDYGSSLRHLTPFLVVWVAFFWQPQALLGTRSVPSISSNQDRTV